MTSRRLSLFLGLAVTFLLSVPVASPQEPSIEELKKEIAAMKESLIAIQKDLQEIKALLQGRRAPAPRQNVLLDLADNPFKGERTAKLTLVEFSDYQ